MALLDDVKTVVRIAEDDTVFDVELNALIGAAKEDMERVGIDPGYIESEAPMVKQAVFCYVKAHFGYDNPDSARFDRSYRQTVTDLMHSHHNSSAGDGLE